MVCSACATGRPCSSRPARTTTLIVHASSRNENALVIFGYSFLFENQDKPSEGWRRRRAFQPTTETIGDGFLPVSASGSSFYIKERAIAAVIAVVLEEFVACTVDVRVDRSGRLLSCERGLYSALRRAPLRRSQDRVEQGKSTWIARPADVVRPRRCRPRPSGAGRPASQPEGDELNGHGARRPPRPLRTDHHDCEHGRRHRSNVSATAFLTIIAMSLIRLLRRPVRRRRCTRTARSTRCIR